MAGKWGRESLMISRRAVMGGTALALALSLSPLGMAARAGTGEVPGDVGIGDMDAPITVIEYFSLTCPHCRTFHRITYPKIKSAYVETGKVRYVMRDFPLNLPALHAAMLARCAGPERYFAFVDTLFDAFDDWARSSDYMEALTEIGEIGGIGRPRFEACLEDRALEDRIYGSIQTGQEEYGVSGTPTLVVNGRIYEGALQFDAIAEHFDGLPGS